MAKTENIQQTATKLLLGFLAHSSRLFCLFTTVVKTNKQTRQKLTHNGTLKHGN